MKHNNNSKITLRWLSQVACTSKWLVAGLVALQSLLSLTGIFYAFVLRAVINAAVAGNRRGFFGCLALLGGRLRRFELRYGVRAHRWTLWRFLDREAPAGRCEFSVHPHM